MQWTPGGRSDNLEDRRDEGPRQAGGFGLPLMAVLSLVRGGRLGLAAILLIIMGLFYFGGDLLSMFSPSTGDPSGVQTRSARQDPEEPAVQFVSFVLDDAQNTWRRVLPTAGVNYRDAKLVLFRQGVQSGCGFAGAETGPFYCPRDEKVYLDLSFFDELRQRFRAAGDFAQAYVLAHEIGHHVQTLLGTVRRSSTGVSNAESVRTELQADCFAGIWGHSTAQRKILDQGDVEEALNAAAAIGDDRIQRRTSGRVNPESFTHGSSAQRVAWFRRGLETGRVADCDTFSSAMP
jgi:predicted metalloprotease